MKTRRMMRMRMSRAATMRSDMRSGQSVCWELEAAACRGCQIKGNRGLRALVAT